MPVKENQPRVYQALRAWFDDPPPLRTLDFRTATHTSKGHGRLERRTLTASIELNGYLDWPAVAQALCLDRIVIIPSTGEFSHQRRYAVTSLSPQQASAQQLLHLWRGHWTIENRLHYPLDVLFREDASRLRSGPTALAMACLRRIVIQFIRSLSPHSSLKLARERFAARPLYALDLLEIGV